MAEEAAQNHRNDLVAFQSLRSRISQENRHKIEDNIAGRVKQRISTCGRKRLKHGKSGTSRQKSLYQAGCRNSGNDGCEDLGNLLENQVKTALIASLGSAVIQISHQRKHRIINLCHLRAAYYLELSACNYNGDYALQMLYYILLGLAVIL